MTGTTGPYRIVDRYHRGWIITGSDSDPLYRCYIAMAPPRTPGPFRFPEHPPETRLSQLRETSGPLRSVDSISDSDRAAVRDALRASGDQAILAAAYAVCVVADTVRDPDSQQPATQRMVAGRPGSWESSVLLELIEASSSNRTFPVPVNAADDPPVAALVTVIKRWVASDDIYIEVAETLARLLGAVIDETGGPVNQNIDPLVNAGLAWPGDWTNGVLNWLCSLSRIAHESPKRHS